MLKQIDNFDADARQRLIGEVLGQNIKWSETLKRRLLSWDKLKFSEDLIVSYLERPFQTSFYYAEAMLSDRLTARHGSIFGKGLKGRNRVICFSGVGSGKGFSCLATDLPFSLDLIEKTQSLPLRFSKGGERIDNITDFALKAFRDHYRNVSISRENIFHYVYAVLQHPAYREKYALNLRQEFPRVPFYPDFGRWVAWGRELMDLHVGFETVTPYPLEQVETPPKGDTPEARALAARGRLKVVRDAARAPTGAIELDGLTTLRGVPPGAWSYRLGNRSALEWVLERHKETTPKDPTIRERFDTYRFADHKERVVDLLARVTTVSVETVRILGEMPGETV